MIPHRFLAGRHRRLSLVTVAGAIVSATLLVPLAAWQGGTSPQQRWKSIASWSFSSSKQQQQQQQTYLRKSTSSLSSSSSDESDATTQLSLWLLLPDKVQALYQAEIDRLATLAPHASGISFLPHVTLVGGISVEKDNINSIVTTLQDALQGFGSVPCTFSPDVVFETTTTSSSNSNNTTNQAVWNQAAILVMEQSPEYLQLCKLARQSLLFVGHNQHHHHNNSDNEDSHCRFAPPVNQPHLSLYYGRDGVPTADDMIASHNNLPLSFNSTSVAVWQTTTPASNEQDVRAWQPVATWDLV